MDGEAIPLASSNTVHWVPKYITGKTQWSPEIDNSGNRLGRTELFNCYVMYTYVNERDSYVTNLYLFIVMWVFWQ